MLKRIIWIVIGISCFSLLATANYSTIKVNDPVSVENPIPKIYDMEEMQTRLPTVYVDYMPEIGVQYTYEKKDDKNFDKEVRCLQKNIFFESRDQPLLGQLMVALVTIERKNNVRYPDTICDVVYQKKQFSWTNERGRKTKPNLSNSIEKDAWETAGLVAKFSMMLDNGKPVLNVTHYHTTEIHPKWANHLKELYVVADHVFYAERG